MRNSIKTKSAAFLGTLLLLTVSVLSYLVLNGIKNNQQKNYENLLSQQAKLANLYVNQAFAAENYLKADVFLKSRGQEIAKQIGLFSSMHVILYNMKGEEAANSLPQGEKIDIQDTLAFSLQGNTTYQVMGESLDYLAPVYVSNVQVGVVQLNYSLKENNIFYNDILRLFVITGGLTFLVSFIIGYSYFNSMTTDILKLKNAVERIKSGIYENITILKRKDELNQLSKGIYFMSSQIQENIKAMKDEQEKLGLAVDKLRILEKAQKHFIGNITHEFKTPLTVIKAYIDLMEMYADDPELVEDAKVKIGAETQRLYDMVEKTLNLTALDKYDFESQNEEIETKGLIQHICSRLEGKIKKFDLKMHSNLQEAVIWADRENMSQIFINLLDNAIKYNKPNGEIYIRSYINDNSIYIEIMNTGMSIPEEARDKIFEPFYRVDKDRSRETGGVGLGLALVKKLVEKQNGNIKLLDNDEEGAAFQLMFPIFL
jgi:two-component system, OmpR family, phosphate regulon sensor histidine kinase PhoR